MSGHRSSLNEKITLCPGFDKLIWLELKTSLPVPWMSLSSTNPLKSEACMFKIAPGGVRAVLMQQRPTPSVLTSSPTNPFGG